MSGSKILEGLKDAVAGNFASVTIEGQRWVRADAPSSRMRVVLQAIADDQSVPAWIQTLAQSALDGAVEAAMPNREQIGRTLYECEKKRGENADAVMKGISPKASDALLMEPWEECKDSFLSDADAVLSLFGSATQQDITRVQAVAAAILPVVDRVGTFTSEDRALEIAKLAVAALPRSAAMTDDAADQLVIAHLDLDRLGVIRDDEDRELSLSERIAELSRTTASSAGPVAWQTRYQFPNGQWDIWHHCSKTVYDQMVEGKPRGLYSRNELRPLYATPPSVGNADAVREAAIDECLSELTGSYLGHAWLNAACAALRSLKENAALRAPVAGAKQWHHTKSGHVVTEIGRGRVQAAKPIVEMQNVVIYEHGGNMWVRAVTEFEDGRFEAIAAPRNHGQGGGPRS